MLKPVLIGLGGKRPVCTYVYTIFVLNELYEKLPDINICEDAWWWDTELSFGIYKKTLYVLLNNAFCVT